MRYNFNSFSFIQQNENLEQQNKQQEEGTFVPERAVDALTKALGKPDRHGHVKALGGNVGYEKAFGPLDRKARMASQSVCSSEELDALRSSLTQFEATFEERLQERVAQEVQKHVKTMMEQMSGLHMPNLGTPNLGTPNLGTPKYHTNVTNSSLPFREIKVNNVVFVISTCKINVFI